MRLDIDGHRYSCTNSKCGGFAFVELPPDPVLEAELKRKAERVEYAKQKQAEWARAFEDA